VHEPRDAAGDDQLGTLIIALPDLERALHTSILSLVWVILAYMISSTVLVLFAGRLSDLFGPQAGLRRRFVLFALASLGAGFAGGGTELIVWRVLQGIGGAFLFANSPRWSPTPSRASSSGWRWGPTRWSRRSGS
jgi:MFS family permease